MEVAVIVVVEIKTALKRLLEQIDMAKQVRPVLAKPDEPDGQ